MKRYITFLFIVFSLFATNMVFSTEINVQPFVPDALFNAVSTASAGDILVLADGGIYPNSAEIPSKVPITIKTADNAANKATVVFIADAAGTYPANVLKAEASLTLKNVIFDMQQGEIRAWGGRFINRGTIKGGKIHVDGIEVYHYGHLSEGGDCDTLIVENSFFNAGVKAAGGWGATWDWQGDIIKYVRIQNNTFMFSIFGPFLGSGWGNYNANTINEVIIDHNTVYNITGAHGPTTMFTRAKNVKLTNNLFVNPTFRPNEFFSDKYLDFPQNADDITPFIGQISHLGPKGIWIVSLEMVDSAATSIDMRANNIGFSSEVKQAWSTRGLNPCWVYTNETAAVIKDVSAAYFEEEVSFVDAPAVPMFAINAIADSTVKGNANPTAYAGKTPFSGYAWYDGVTPTYDFRVKSAMNMAYNTNAKSYTAGDKGLPLGDLNWFPEKKQEWITAIEKNKSSDIPDNFELAQNYPNPFNPTTTIFYSLKKTADVNLTIFNTLGQPVKTLVNGKMNAGSHSEQWDGTNEIGAKVVSGIYYYRLVTENQSQTMKMVLMK